LGRFTQIDPMSAKYPGLSPYLYCADNPILYTDPDGKDFGIYVHEHGAGGNGHTTLYFQNGEGQWFTYDQGARDNNPSLISAATLGVSAGVTINQVDRLPQGAIRVKTSIEQDKLITQSALKSQIDHKTGEKKYQLSSNNCTDAAVDVINDSGTGIELENPWNIIKPNTWFKYLKSLKKQYGETEGEGIDETSVKLEGDKYEVVH